MAPERALGSFTTSVISLRNQIRPLGWANLWGCPLDLCRKMPLQCPVPFREVAATLKGLLSPALSSRGGEGEELFRHSQECLTLRFCPSLPRRRRPRLQPEPFPWPIPARVRRAGVRSRLFPALFAPEASNGSRELP